jgi:hypothetical protein
MKIEKSKIRLIIFIILFALAPLGISFLRNPSHGVIIFRLTNVVIVVFLFVVFFIILRPK